MSRPRDFHPVFDGDPTPGDVNETREFARRCKTMADAICAATDGLAKLRVEGDAQSMTTYRVLTEDTAGEIGRVEPRYRAMADGIRTWAEDLDDLQTRAGAALARAQPAEDDRLRYQARINAAADAAEAVLLQPFLDEALRTIGAERAIVEGIHQEWHDKAHIRARPIDYVISNDEVKDGFWDNVASFVGGLANVTSKLAAAIGVSALVIGAIPVIGAPIAGILGTVALGLSAVTLVANLGLMISGKGGSLEDTVWAAVGVASFGVGRAMGVLAQRSAIGARAAARIGTTRALRDTGMTHSAAARQMRAALGTAQGATHHALHAAPGRLLPSLRDGLRLGYGGLKSELVDDAAAARHAVQEGWTPIGQGLRNYGSGGLHALVARGTGFHQGADDLARLDDLKVTLQGLPNALDRTDALRVAELASRSSAQIRVATGAVGATAILEAVTDTQ